MKNMVIQLGKPQSFLVGPQKMWPPSSRGGGGGKALVAKQLFFWQLPSSSDPFQLVLPFLTAGYLGLC